MRKKISWSWESLSHQGTSAPSIRGLAWDSKPHVPQDKWLLVTNKSSFGNPRLSTLMSQDPNQSKRRDIQRMRFVLALFACCWLSVQGSHFCFLCKILGYWMNSCRWVLGGKKAGYHDTYDETAKGCKPTLFILNLRFIFPFANQRFVMIMDMFVRHS